MYYKRKQPWQEEESESDEDLSNNEPVQMNFLEEIKGHLDGDLSFETSVHDIYNPAFSQSVSHRVKEKQDSAFKKIRQNSQSNKSTKSETSLNLICSIDNYCHQMEILSSQSLPDETNKQSIQQVKKKQQIDFLYEKILSNKKK